VVVAVGCTSSDSGSSGLQPPDPGGTFGSEITVRVVGAGHVTSAPLSIDCPTRCYSTFLFDPAAASAKTGVALAASPSPGWTFTGWSFDGAPVPGRARQPDECQPYSRAGTVPKTDTASPTLTLMPGQGPGTAPATKGAGCSPTSDLPLAYQVTATFTKVPDAGGGGDAGTDSGTLEGDLVYDTPSPGAAGRKIFARSGRLYWQWDVAGASGISSASSLSGSFRTDLASPTVSLSGFDVDQEVVYQATASLALTSFTLGSTFATTLPSAPSCAALASDFSYVYCRQAAATDSILRWTTGGTGPTTIASKLPTGSDLSVDATSIYYSDGAVNGAVYAIPLAGAADGGAPTPTLIADLQTLPSNVQVNSSYAVWINGAGSASSALSQALRAGGGTASTITTQSYIRDFVIDGTSSAANVYFTVSPSNAPGASSILRVSILGGAVTTVKSGLYAPGGVAVDASYVYWTNGEGKVLRAPKF